MQKHLGTSAGFLGLFAVLIHTVMPPASEQGSNGPPVKTSSEAHSTKLGAGVGKKVQQGSARNKKEDGTASDSIITEPEEGPWLASRQYFHSQPAFNTNCIDPMFSSVDSNKECSSAEMSKLFGVDHAPISPQVVIATIPDPLHTRMSLSSDRDLDAIQGAAFEAGWEMAAQWLPWTESAGRMSPASHGAASPPLKVENMPGLIVFRPHFTDFTALDRLLFIFVVGETPTSGINGFQFAAALRCLHLLTSSKPLPGDTIRILGPRFSGSFLSLTKLIEEDQNGYKYEIRSGSVSNSDYAASMLASFASKPARSVDFHGSTLPSVSFSAQFRQLAKRQGMRDSEVAELVEDESGFSYGIDPALVDKPSVSKYRTYRYPRDIAQLRDAYSDVAFSAQSKSGAAPSPALQLSLKDSQSGESDFPTFSTSHTPVSQNAILEQIVDDLRHQRVRLLSLSASNVFDALFIANVLAKECPEIRIVVNGADLLFVQQATQNSLSGILGISPFPMFAEGFKWTNSHDVETTFPDADSVGEYNATLELLSSNISPSERKKKLIAFAPSWENDRSWFSSAWLLVLGRQGWGPVDLFQQENPVLKYKSKPLGSWFDTETPIKQNGTSRFPLAAPPIAWTILCLPVTGLSFTFCGRLAYLMVKLRTRSWSALCTIDIFKGGISRLGHARYLWFFCCLSSLVFLNGLLLVPMMNRGVVGLSLRLIATVATAAPLLAALFLLYQINAGQKNPPKGFVPDFSKRFQLIVRIGSVLLILLPLVGLFLWYELCFMLGASSHFFSFRVLNLALPISPIWPPLLGTTAVFALAFFHLRRLTWAERQQPMLDTSLFKDALWGHIGDTYDDLNKFFSGHHVAKKPALRWTSMGSAVFLLCLLFLLFPSGGLNSFEHPFYGTILTVLFLPLCIAISSTLIRFAFSWHMLRDLVTTLNSLEIGRFFERFPDFDGSGPVWIRDLTLMSLATSVNSAIALHNLHQEMPQVQVDREAYWEALRAFSAPTQTCDRLAMLTVYRRFLAKSAEISGALSKQVLEPFWKDHRLPFVQGRIVKGTSDAPVPTVQVNFAEGALKSSAPLAFAATAVGASQPATAGVQSISVSAAAYEMAFKYVTLQYSIFIGYALRHIQNFLMCSVISFVLLVLALNLFSFDDTQSLSRLLMAALVIGGVVVVRVLAQIERNPIISRISGSEEGELGKEFYQSMIIYGAIPVLTVLGTQFPSVARFLTSWVEPTLAALK